MPKPWTKIEKKKYHKELYSLYIIQNKTISEISVILKIAEQTVFDRLKRLKIKTCPELKPGYLRKKTDIILPIKYDQKLAEFFGIMFGDGHVSHFQTQVTLGNKEEKYVKYVAKLLSECFSTKANISIRKKGYFDVYIGSVDITAWLLKEGLVHNKVKNQVNAPKWIFRNKNYMKSFLRGFFDTDGSIYLLKYGIQMAFCNRSLPLLFSIQKMLIMLGYKASRVSGYNIYLTKTCDISRFFAEIKPKNSKHITRYKSFLKLRNAPVG